MKGGFAEKFSTNRLWINNKDMSTFFSIKQPENPSDNRFWRHFELVQTGAMNAAALYIDQLDLGVHAAL